VLDEIVDGLPHAELANTLTLSAVSAVNYDAVFCPGGHGPLWDLVSDTDSIRLIEALSAAEKPVAAVCHAPIVSVNAKDAAGDYLVRWREVTRFTNDEEAAVALTDVVPLPVEDTLIDRGAKYSKAEDFVPYVRQDGLLITGQNPASSTCVAEHLLRALA